MLLKLALLALAVSSTDAIGAAVEFREQCLQDMAHGLQTLQNAYSELGEGVAEERVAKLRKMRSGWPNGMGDASASTISKRHEQAKTGEADQRSSCAAEKNGFKCSPDKEEAKRVEHRYSRLSHDYPHAIDPFAFYAELLHGHLTNASACEGAGTFTDLNSITSAQINGFLALLATNSAGPFCPICHRMVDELHDKLLKPFELVSGKRHGLVSLLLSHVPSSKVICSAVAPVCHENYADKASVFSEGAVCLSCSLCNIITNIVQHKVLLNQVFVDRIYEHLHNNFFDGACHEMCCDAEEFPTSLQMNYDKCQEEARKLYYRLVDAARQLLRPERFCVLEMHFCELNETPNIMHCARELCEEAASNAFTQWLCTLIPDRPKDADKFLNVQRTKVYKKKGDAHLQHEESMRKKRAAGEL